MFELPSNATPLIVLAVCSLDAVKAFPSKLPFKLTKLYIGIPIAIELNPGILLLLLMVKRSEEQIAITTSFTIIFNIA